MALIRSSASKAARSTGDASQVYEAAEEIKNKAQEAAGNAKEKAGDKTGDEELEREGKADKTKANMKQAGEHAKDAAKNARDAFKD